MANSCHDARYMLLVRIRLAKEFLVARSTMKSSNTMNQSLKPKALGPGKPVLMYPHTVTTMILLKLSFDRLVPIVKSTCGARIARQQGAKKVC